MPTRPKTHAQRQAAQRTELKGQYDRDRGPDRQFYGKTRWRKLRTAFRIANPLCAECGRAGRVVVGEEVHHLKPRRDYPELEFDWDNLEHLCKSCHSRITIKERTERRL